MNDDTRTCPFCAETIKSAANICRFCKSSLESPVNDCPGPQATLNPQNTTDSLQKNPLYISWRSLLIAYGCLVGLFTVPTYWSAQSLVPGIALASCVVLVIASFTAILFFVVKEPEWTKMLTLAGVALITVIAMALLPPPLNTSDLASAPKQVQQKQQNKVSQHPLEPLQISSIQPPEEAPIFPQVDLTDSVNPSKDLGFTLSDFKKFFSKACNNGDLQLRLVKTDLPKDDANSFLMSFSDGSSMMGTIDSASGKITGLTVGGEGSEYVNILAMVIALSVTTAPDATSKYRQVLDTFVQQPGQQIVEGQTELDGLCYRLQSLGGGYMFTIGN